MRGRGLLLNFLSYTYIINLFIIVKAGRYPGIFIRRNPDRHLVPGRDYVDLCETPDGFPGECRPLSACWIADYEDTELESCQFYGGVEFFCCPDKTDDYIEFVSSGTHDIPPIDEEKPAIDVLLDPMKAFLNKFIVPGLGALIQTETTTSPFDQRTTKKPNNVAYTVKLPWQMASTSTRRPTTSTRRPAYNRLTTTGGRDWIHPISQSAHCGQRASKLKDKFGEHETKEIQPFILGGINSQELSWPWMASIHSWNQFRLSRFICGGSLITVRHILSAAHCFENKSNIVRYSAILGLTDLRFGSREERNPTPQNHLHITRIKIHDRYIEKMYYHDIAILTLSENVRLSEKVSTVCLPTAQDFISLNTQTTVTVAGWGDTSYGGVSSYILQEAKLQIVNFSRCQNSYDKFRTKSLPRGITSDMLCAGTPEGTGDACQGDSGGPLVLERGNQWTQIGIVSFGYQCGIKDYPGVYTKVSSYRPWIQQVLHEEGLILFK